MPLVDDLVAIVLTLAVMMVGAAAALIILIRSRRWEADHPVAVRRYAMVGAGLGVTPAGFWIGRFFGLW